jgi:hypothetical protein
MGYQLVERSKSRQHIFCRSHLGNITLYKGELLREPTVLSRKSDEGSFVCCREGFLLLHANFETFDVSASFVLFACNFFDI